MVDQDQEVLDEDKPFPLWMMLILPVYAAFAMSLFVFPFAGSLRWIPGWLFVGTFSLNIGVSYLIINQKNPRVMRNRAKMRKSGITDDTRKSAGSDRIIIPVMTIGFLGSMFLPGYLYKENLYQLGYEWIITGLIIANIGVAIFSKAQLDNAYGSKILDINKDQKLVDTGLYARVRHPMYSGGILMFIGIPLALGSWIPLFPALIAIFSLVVRIKYEEDMLIVGMEGYEEYRQRVPYKLVPKLY